MEYNSFETCAAAVSMKRLLSTQVTREVAVDLQHIVLHRVISSLLRQSGPGAMTALQRCFDAHAKVDLDEELQAKVLDIQRVLMPGRYQPSLIQGSVERLRAKPDDRIYQVMSLPIARNALVDVTKHLMAGAGDQKAKINLSLGSDIAARFQFKVEMQPVPKRAEVVDDIKKAISDSLMKSISYCKTAVLDCGSRVFKEQSQQEVEATARLILQNSVTLMRAWFQFCRDVYILPRGVAWRAAQSLREFSDGPEISAAIVDTNELIEYVAPIRDGVKDQYWFWDG